MAIQITPKVASAVTRNTPAVNRAVTPANPVTPAVTREEFEALRKMVAALKATVEGFSPQSRAAYMREYRKRPKKGI
jgi:hypothetical protein